MRMLFAGVGLAVLAIAASPVAMAQAGYAAPRTSWGAPDLQGVWSNASVTKLTRPAGVDKLVLSPDEAAALENKDFNNARTKAELLPTDQTTGAPVKGKALPSVGNYNAVWVDPGSRIATVRGELRSSFIVDPPNGRVPMSDAGRKKLATWRPDAMRDGTYKPPAEAAIPPSPRPRPKRRLARQPQSQRPRQSLRRPQNPLSISSRRRVLPMAAAPPAPTSVRNRGAPASAAWSWAMPAAP